MSGDRTGTGPGPGETPADSLADPPPDAGEDWTVLDTVVVWENPYFSAGYDEVERPDGSTERYYWVDPDDVVLVVARTDDGDVLLLDQYSIRQRESLLTCPGGVVEDGESFVEAGARELEEETGYRAGETRLLDVYRPDAWLRMVHAVVYATDLQAGRHRRESGEDLTLYELPADDAIEAIRSRSPSYAGGLVPLLLARDEGLV